MSAVWRVRVDLFATQDAPTKRQLQEIHRRLRDLSSADAAMDTAVDQGTGVTRRAVVGMTFWVDAADVGQAAITAVDIARRASEGHGAGPDLYDVTVIPRDAVVTPNDARYPPRPD